MNNFSQLSAENGTLFLVRWRGRQEGPYTGAAVEAKLAAHEMGLLHEIHYSGQWMTVRDYIAGRQAAILVELQAQQEPSTPKLRVQAAQPAWEEEVPMPPPAAQPGKNELLAAELLKPIRPPVTVGVPLKPHRGRLIFLLGVAGCFLFGPICVAAVIMGTADLYRMDTGQMDASGRSATRSGRNIGILGALLWLAGSVVLFSVLRH